MCVYSIAFMIIIVHVSSFKHNLMFCANKHTVHTKVDPYAPIST